MYTSWYYRCGFFVNYNRFNSAELCHKSIFVTRISIFFSVGTTVAPVMVTNEIFTMPSPGIVNCITVSYSMVVLYIRSYIGIIKVWDL